MYLDVNVYNYTENWILINKKLFGFFTYPLSPNVSRWRPCFIYYFQQRPTTSCLRSARLKNIWNIIILLLVELVPNGLYKAESSKNTYENGYLQTENDCSLKSIKETEISKALLIFQEYCKLPADRKLNNETRDSMRKYTADMVKCTIYLIFDCQLLNGIIRLLHGIVI